MSMKEIIMEIIYLAMAFMCSYVGVKALKENERANKVPTSIFWFALAALLGLGKILPMTLSNFMGEEQVTSTSNLIFGVLVIVMTLPAMINKISTGKNEVIPDEHKEKMAAKFGGKIFIPALTMGVCALIFGSLVPSLGSQVGLGIGILISAITILIMSKDKVSSIPKEGTKILEVVGPLSILPQLLAALGAIFATAGVGEVISELVSPMVPEGNVMIAIIIYAIAMALFTMIMGNAFAAFSVITIGIGIPFILEAGLNPNIIGIIGLTSGYCGTLLTPMAANFNMVPVAILDIKDKYGVIKKQAPIAIVMLVVQIILMKIMG